MKTKHTPAPWIIQNEDSAETVFYIQCKSGSLGSAYNKAGGEGIANARLIAAAPELLKELQRVSEQARTFLQSDSFGLIKKKDFNQQAKNRLGAIIETAEAAIQKATGHEAN